MRRRKHARGNRALEESINNSWVTTVMIWIRDNVNLNFVGGLHEMPEHGHWTAAIVVIDAPGSERWRLEICNYRKVGNEIIPIGDILISNPHKFDHDRVGRFIEDLRQAIKTNHPEWLQYATAPKLSQE